MTISDVFDRTGISRAQISKIENGKVDPRMSTVTHLLSCYGMALGDLEPTSEPPLTLKEIKQRAKLSAERLERVGLGPSDPKARLARKSDHGQDPRVESDALATRT